MPSGALGTYPVFHGFDGDGNPLEGGKLYSFLSGTSTPKSLYADAELTTELPNPLILNASGEATFYYGNATYGLTLTDAQDVPLWTIDPVTGGGGAAASGIGFGQHTVELAPRAGDAQASALVFPPGVLALAVSVWVSETCGTGQGLECVGIGTAALPDCWGYLGSLAAQGSTTAGIFEGYSGQPQPQDGMVTLTAYGGLFDGTGVLYLTGHFATFRAGQQAGYGYLPVGVDSAPLPVATTDVAGVVELATVPEHVDGLRDDLVCTPLGLQAALDAVTGNLSASETVVGITRYGTDGESGEGNRRDVAVHPAGLAATLAPVESAVFTLETVTATLETDLLTVQNDVTVLQGKLPTPQTALSVARYAAGAGSLEGTPGLTTSTSGQLGMGMAPEGTNQLSVTGGVRLRQGFLDQIQEGGNASYFATVYSNTAGQGAQYAALRARGTEGAQTAVTSGTLLLRVGARGHDGTSIHTSMGAFIDLTATETWSSTARGTRVTLSTTLSGTTTVAERWRIDGNGYVGVGTTAPKFPLHVGGALAHGLPTAEPVSTELANGQMVWWLNEADNTLRGLIKRSDGTLRRVSLTTTA